MRVVRDCNGFIIYSETMPPFCQSRIAMPSFNLLNGMRKINNN